VAAPDDCGRPRGAAPSAASVLVPAAVLLQPHRGDTDVLAAVGVAVRRGLRTAIGNERPVERDAPMEADALPLRPLFLECTRCFEWVPYPKPGETVEHTCNLQQLRERTCDHVWERRPPYEAGILLTNTCTKCGAKVA